MNVVASAATMELEDFVLRLTGPLTLETTAPLWRQAALLGATDGHDARIDVEGVPRCDTAGAALLIHLRRLLGGVAIEGASEQVRFMLDVMDRPCPEPPTAPPADRRPGMVETLGTFATQVLRNAADTVEYIGGLIAGFGEIALHPRRLRWPDTIVYMARTGADALGIVVMINGLMGLILAFQMGAQMRQYGADTYVADVVGMSIIQELGPLMTAILVCGRSGSAFAAEIGTMKVNEEVAALDTMGLERTRFLVMPKMVALLLMMPLLVVFADLAGVFGGMVIGTTYLDQPIGVYLGNTIARIGLWDVGQGLIKGEAYAIVIAAVGCLRGLQTGKGAQGVGVSATSAVVSGIFLIIVVDAILTVIFHAL